MIFVSDRKFLQNPNVRITNDRGLTGLTGQTSVILCCLFIITAFRVFS